MKKFFVCALFLLPSASFAGDVVRQVTGWQNRSYLLHIPSHVTRPLPLVMVLHGAGHNREIMRRITCPQGVVNRPGCLDSFADRNGFIVVYPNGSVNPEACAKDPKYCEQRTWNAGGGKHGFNCTSAYACKSGIDDIKFFKDLWNDIDRVVKIDRNNIFSTGLSNGGSMSHRLACELASEVAAIAPVGGGNQFSTSSICSPVRPLPVLEIHGTADIAWPYNGGPSQLPGVDGNMFSIPKTLSDWMERDRCVLGAGSFFWMKDRVNDGTHIGVGRNDSCAGRSEVVHYMVVNGGHQWPGGWNYNPRLGPVSHQVSANLLIGEFFKRHRR